MLIFVGPEKATVQLCSSLIPPNLVNKSLVQGCNTRSNLKGENVQVIWSSGRKWPSKLNCRGPATRRTCTSHLSRDSTSDCHKFSRLQGTASNEDGVSTSDSKEVHHDTWGGWRASVLATVASGYLLFGPSIDARDVIIFSPPSALAASMPIAQMRPGSMMLEKLIGGFKSTKVLDKVVTVVSGQAVVNPEELGKDLKEILEGPDSFEKWRNGLLDNAQDALGTTVDLISHLTPEGVQESATASFTGFVEAGAERFAAFEISALVGLTERWLIYIPLVVLPMAWQMRARSNARAEDARAREERRVILSEETQAKAERVRRELERINLKTSLLEVVDSLGVAALQPLRDSPQMRAKDVKDMVEKLKILTPSVEKQLNPSDPGSTLRSGNANDAFADIPAVPELDGDWSLIYASEAIRSGDVSWIPGVEIHNPRQRVWQKASTSNPVLSLDSEIIGSSLLVANNIAEIRLGPLGVLEVAVQGSWQSLRNGQAGLVSFDHFSARPKEIFGARMSEDLPPVSLPLPRALQQSAEWEVLYLDETMRINRGQQGQLFIFKREMN